ncbi:kinase-like protein [Phlegmacium glaucopus]|nr:kinase-like protein [Phlegmacium glaucopus]
MALGLAALHSLGILHRDFKPENVLIDYRGNVRTANFGSSKIADECAPYLPGRPCAHESNEKKAKRVPYGIEADYWSLGCIIFELESVLCLRTARNSIGGVLTKILTTNKNSSKLKIRFPFTIFHYNWYILMCTSGLGYTKSYTILILGKPKFQNFIMLRIAAWTEWPMHHIFTYNLGGTGCAAR